jgi:hypothetical protein
MNQEELEMKSLNLEGESMINQEYYNFGKA